MESENELEIILEIFKIFKIFRKRFSWNVYTLNFFLYPSVICLFKANNLNTKTSYGFF